MVITVVMHFCNQQTFNEYLEKKFGLPCQIHQYLAATLDISVNCCLNNFLVILPVQDENGSPKTVQPQSAVSNIITGSPISPADSKKIFH